MQDFSWEKTILCDAHDVHVFCPVFDGDNFMICIYISAYNMCIHVYILSVLIHVTYNWLVLASELVIVSGYRTPALVNYREI